LIRIKILAGERKTFRRTLLLLKISAPGDKKKNSKIQDKEPGVKKKKSQTQISEVGVLMKKHLNLRKPREMPKDLQDCN
jgi:hypothetical protein